MGRLLRNRTVVQSLLSLVCRLTQSGKVVDHEQGVSKFFLGFLDQLNRQVELGQRATDPEFLEFQRTVNANIKEGARVRQQVLLRKLLASNPGFAEIFDPAVVVESGLKASIATDAAEVVAIVGRLNEQYSAVHGEDLFKATNRTVQAQANLRKVTEDFVQYKALMEDLYFLFWESVGSRLDGRVPAAFTDVNTLRTDLQHDIDHGKKPNIRAKKKKIGHVFAKYAGSPSPVGLAPDRFIVVQANTLAALKHDIRQLKP